MEQMLVENLKNKWEPVLNCEGMAPIQDDYRRNVTAILLENQEKALKEEANVTVWYGVQSDTNGAFNQVAAFDPVLISLVRRAMPNLIAYDICGVQPMSGPTGLIFAMKAKYLGASGERPGTEALFNEAVTDYANKTVGDNNRCWFPIFGGTGDPLGDRETLALVVTQ